MSITDFASASGISGDSPSNAASIGSTGLAETGGGTGKPAGVEGTAIGGGGVGSGSGAASSSVAESFSNLFFDQLSFHHSFCHLTYSKVFG